MERLGALIDADAQAGGAVMTSRERVLTAVNHEEPDRVPLFVGTSGVTTLLGPAYERLRAHLGIEDRPPAWISPLFGYALMDEDVLRMLGRDGHPGTGKMLSTEGPTRV